MSAGSAAAVLGLLHCKNHHNTHRIRCRATPNSDRQLRMPSTDNIHNGAVGRREASLTLAGLCCAYLLNHPSIPFSLPPAQAAQALSEPSQCSSLAVAPSGLAFCDLVVGTGAGATQGQLIKAHYVGRFENGKVFDSSYGRGKPLTFRVGVGEVIKGWDQGILGGDGVPPMLAGGKRVLKLPPELAYGLRGAGCRGGSCVIPPNSTLLFDVEFIGKA